jgi:putative Mn2+ efflux pump MntP
MTVIGWWLGSGMEQLIHDYDHWVAFALLLLIGGKMTVESFGNKEQKTVNLLNNKILITAAIATSIDALAIGISLALIQLSITRIAMGGLIIAAVTAIASFIGLHSGRRLGKKFGRWAELTGGVILIGLGIKIVLEHTGIL